MVKISPRQVVKAYSRNGTRYQNLICVLERQQCNQVENVGFIKDNRGTIKAYTQTKKGFGYFYAKRKVQPDSVSTTHLDI